MNCGVSLETHQPSMELGQTQCKEEARHDSCRDAKRDLGSASPLRANRGAPDPL